MAMHELCEVPKGEGTTEGFDAHLNIEQMNKTCVDLFQVRVNGSVIWERLNACREVVRQS